MFEIKIANLRVRVDNRYGYVAHLCREYVVEPCENPDLLIRVEESEILSEMAMVEHEVTDSYAEAICVYRKICQHLPQKFQAFLMHCAVIEYEGRGYAFAARSGTGKSTHIALWQKRFGDGVTVINGDKPIFRFLDGKLYAFGTPWCGKEGLHTNAATPLAAICFLERSPVNTIHKISPGEAIGRIFQQILTPDDLPTLDALIPLLDSMLCEIPCYSLGCNISEEAAEVAYFGMKNETEKGSKQ